MNVYITKETALNKFPKEYALIKFPETHNDVCFIWYGIFTVQEFYDFLEKVGEGYLRLSRTNVDDAKFVGVSFAVGGRSLSSYENLVDVIIYEDELDEIVILS